jgi:hypothetical protein
MSYAKQDSAGKRLHAESIKDLHGKVDGGWKKIDKRWKETRRALRSHIMDTYRQYFGNGPWDLAAFAASGANHAMFGGVTNRLEEFKHYSMAEAKKQLNDIYKHSILRHAWILDQLTPPCYKTRIPHRFRLYEADIIQVYQGAQASARWQNRWTAWVDAYNTSLISNLRLGAINASNMSDSADEVDATRAGSPMYDLVDALNRIFESQAIYAISAGEQTVANVNGDAGVEEIWQTVHDFSVCEICEPLDGLTVEEAGVPPEHPNCRCYLRIVPASWAELLRAGDIEDQMLAKTMDAQGLVPNAMVIRDEAGQTVGYDIVDFGRWIDDNVHAVGAGL